MILPGPTAHMPFMQVWKGPHTVPQLPQLFRSVFRSEQPPAQGTCPGGHVAVGLGLAVGVGDALVGAFVTLIVIVWELSVVLVTVTLIWLLPSAEV
jgi:hypothetical protein